MSGIEPQEHFGFRVRMVNNLIKRKMSELFEQQENNSTTGVQHWIICNLMDEPDKDFFQKDIENKLNIRRSTATGILKLMEQNGLIERVPVDYDARLKKIVLTEKAITEERRNRELIDRFERKIIEDISESELKACYAVIDKVIKNLEEM